MPTKKDLWERVVKEMSIDLSAPISFVTAKQLKQITGEEPRLMASMNEESDVPTVFRNKGVFVLPVSRVAYALVRGKGYHEVEQISSPPIEHVASVPLSVSEMGTGTVTETQYIDYAYNTGLLERFLEVSRLWLGPRGKMTTPRFEFRVQSSPVTVDRAQIELDSSYIGGDFVFPLEAKVGIPRTVSIKQIYYPFRTVSIRYPKSRIRPLFFAFDQIGNSYNLWEYAFLDELDYESLTSVRRERFQIRVEPIPPQAFLGKTPDLTSFVPQADDFEKVLEFPLNVAKGVINSANMAKAFGFTVRQSSYYRQAAQMLQLVRLRDNEYELTELGRRFVELPTAERNRMACELLFRHPIMHGILAVLIENPDEQITRKDIISLIEEKSKLTGTTPKRRSLTILRWLEWMQKTVGVVVVQKDAIRLCGERASQDAH